MSLVDDESTAALMKALGGAADEGVMPTQFAIDGARSGYSIEKINRSLRIADFLLAALDLTELSSLLACPIVSLGGGPGFDFVSAAILHEFIGMIQKQTRKGVNALVLDIEPGWKSCVVAFDRAVNRASRPPDTETADNHIVSFATCDITAPLMDNPALLTTLTAGMVHYYSFTARNPYFPIPTGCF